MSAVTLRKLGRSVRVASSGAEPVYEGDVQDAIRRLKSRGLVRQFVYTHLPPEAVQVLVEEIPLAGDEELRVQYEAAQEERIGREGMVFRHAWIETEDDQATLVTAAALAQALEERIALVRAAGLEPLHLAALKEEVGTLPGLSPEYAVAASLAAQGLMDIEGEISFWDGPEREHSRNLRGRAEMARLILAIGGVLAIILFALTGARFYLEAEVQSKGDELAPYQARAGILKSEKAELARQTARAEESEALASGGTRVALTLAHLARVSPEGLWFEKLRVEGDSSRALITIEGRAHTDALVAQFMRRLETGGVVEDVRLVEVRGDVPAENALVRSDSLVSFQITSRSR